MIEPQAFSPQPTPPDEVRAGEVHALRLLALPSGARTSGSKASPHAELFVAYRGPSMNPTLLEGDLLEVRPYGARSVQVGDVLYFVPPGGGAAVVHRAVRRTPQGLITRGDNNPVNDTVLLLAEHILGQVTAAWRGQQRRPIAGGWQGRLWRRLLAVRGAVWGVVSTPLRPLYHALAGSGLIARLLPRRWRPRLVAFGCGAATRLRILWGRRIIGAYDPARRCWHIRAPYRLAVDESQFAAGTPSDAGD